ncbi:MAG: nitroreductase family protein [Dehalococcoidia bacterium]|nr:nitroreductase family protein [Dehalococcoidia bacterium]
MQLDELSNLIKARHSIRRWQNKEVPLELLKKAVDLATWAPNGGNKQNWRFYIITNRNTINSIADEVQNTTNQMASWPEAREFVADVDRWRERAGFFRSAPAAIAVSASQYISEADKILGAREKFDPEASKMRVWRNSANTKIQSVASAIAYLLLILHQMGLGAVWMTGPIQAKGNLEKLLGVPSHMDLVAFIPIGYPGENPVIRGRRPVEEVIEIIS